MSVHEENINQIETMRKNLKNLREEKGWSIQDLSEKSGINSGVLWSVENEQDCEINHLFILCKLYNIEVHKIFSPIKK